MARLQQLQSFAPQNAFEGFREGRQFAQDRENRNAILKAGQAAASGDFNAASSEAFKGGQLQAGAQFRALGLDEQKREVDQIARLAVAADTPEKMQQAAQAIAQKFGPERAREFLSTPREQLIAEAETVSKQLGRQFQEQQARRAQSNSDRAFRAGRQDAAFSRDIAQQRLDIERGKPRGTSTQQDYNAAVAQGFEGTIFDYQKSLAEAKAGGKPLTEAQAKSAGFAERMIASNTILNDDKIIAAAISATETTLSGVPVVGNFLTSEDRKRYEQAQRDFVNAVLRRESGAAIAESEFANAAKQYFPQPGDTPAIIEQKAKNRQTALNGVLRAAGPAAEGLTTPSGGPVQTTPGGIQFKVVQ